MKKKGLKPLGISLIVLLVIALIIVGVVLFSSHPNPTGNAIAGSSTAPIVNVSTTGMMKLSDSPFATYAYLISMTPLSSQAQEAITGFQLNTTSNPDGSTTYILTAVKQSYYNQSYTLQPGQKFILYRKIDGR